MIDSRRQKTLMSGINALILKRKEKKPRELPHLSLSLSCCISETSSLVMLMTAGSAQVGLGKPADALSPVPTEHPFHVTPLQSPH